MRGVDEAGYLHFRLSVLGIRWMLQPGFRFMKIITILGIKLAGLREILEARVGIEPTRKGFADLSLTTWVPRRQLLSISKI
jgi:hypothetical protein